MSDNTIDLNAITAQQLKQLVQSAAEDEVTTAVTAVGTEAVLDRVFGEMEQRFKPGAASGVAADVQFVIDDGATAHPYAVRIAGGGCRAAREEVAGEKVRLTMALPVFLKLVTGVLDGPMAFMSGQLTISGDIMFASRIMNFFERP